MLNVKRFVNNIPYKKQELYKNEISDEAVYKIINKVRLRAKKDGENKIAK